MSPDLSPADRESRSGARWANLLALLLAAISLVTIALSPFNHPDEFNYITASREMVETGDWVTPHFNNAPRLVKPILFYWIVAVAYKVFGVHIAVARLCSATMAAGGITVLWLTGRHLMDRTAALLATVIAAGNVTVVQLSRNAITDPTLWAFCALSNYAFIRLQFPERGADGRHRFAGWSHLFFVALALALLTKGPVALAWCLLPLLWPIILGDWAALRRFRWVTGLALVLLIVGPWTGLFIARNGRAAQALLLDPRSPQSYVHFLAPVKATTTPGILPKVLRTLAKLFGIVPLFLASFFPWLPVLISGAGAALLGRSVTGTMPRRSSNLSRPAPLRQRWRPFMICWLSALIVIFALIEKKDFRYLFPVVAPGAILLADLTYRRLRDISRHAELCRLLAAYGIFFLATVPVLVGIILATHGIPMRMLWAHVAVQALAGALLLGWRGSRSVQWAMPAVITGAISLHMLVLPVTASAISGAGPGTLAPLVRRALAPRDMLLCYELSPRSLVFEARRGQIDTPDFNSFLTRLESAPACLLRQSDWQRVPESTRRQFTLIGQCVAQRNPPVFEKKPWPPDLSRNREAALLLVRRTHAAQGGGTASHRP